MSDKTGIAWTDHTWNPWQGCDHVSPACDNCYMYTEKIRYGQDPTKVVLSKPPTFNRPIATVRGGNGSRWKWPDGGRVFTCSWSDWFHKDADPWRDEAWANIRHRPGLTFQILTKRPALMPRRLPADWRDGYRNVWLGVSVESPDYYSRIDILRDTPAALRFLSLEPLLAPLPNLNLHGMQWVIIGGESGRYARPCDVAWIRGIVGQCREAGVPCFTKQLGARPMLRMPVPPTYPPRSSQHIDHGEPLHLRDSHGGDPSEWPEPFPREFPPR